MLVVSDLTIKLYDNRSHNCHIMYMNIVNIKKDAISSIFAVQNPYGDPYYRYQKSSKTAVDLPVLKYRGLPN